MILIEDKIISNDLLSKQFVCDLSACKGACCIEGDAGAPLEEEERPLLRENYDQIEPYLTEEGKRTIREKGFTVTDEEGLKTPLTEDGPCAYVRYENGIASCGIEKAWEEGKIDFRKPVSCHLYPVRIDSYEQYDAVNYDRWEICDPACDLGQKLKVPVYQFVKNALIRKYGQEFYDALEGVAEYQGVS